MLDRNGKDFYNWWDIMQHGNNKSYNVTNTMK